MFKADFMLPPLRFKSQIFLIIFFLIFFAIDALPAASQAARRVIVIDKANKKVTLWVDGRHSAEFPASFGIDPDSDKYKVHDCATPEGFYVITHKKDETRFHRLLGLSYPNLQNAEKGLADGVISPREYHDIYNASLKPQRTTCETRLGCGIAIHGGGVFKRIGKTRERDWTEGCIALNDADMEKLFDRCLPGDPVIIFNSRKNLYGLVRPFTHIKDHDEKGAPVCPDGVCTYQAEFFTSLGRMPFILQEGKDFGRYIEARVYAADDREIPILVLVDRNGDGYMSSLDSIKGTDVDETKPDEIYRKMRDAVISALSSGQLPDIGSGR